MHFDVMDNANSVSPSGNAYAIKQLLSRLDMEFSDSKTFFCIWRGVQICVVFPMGVES